MAKQPARIDKYEITRRLGHGGMGTVYLGRDAGLDRLVAVKVLRNALFDDELLQRFLREARAAANLRHENIITVYDVGEHEHQPFMAMEYVDGLSLADVIRMRHELSLAEKLSYIEQLCSGLAYAHEKGIVHRDIKPANLMIDQRKVVRILDFGIARTEGSGMTQEGSLIGTLNYMSPEQMLGRAVDYRSDIFAVGAVAYELLAFQQAFPGTLEDGLLHRLPVVEPKPLAELCPGLPDGLADIIAKALAKQPAQRFDNLESMRAAIRDIRRVLDPSLKLEPVTVRRPHGDKGTPRPGSSDERRELLERRARQIAVHREAARAALDRQDIDSAIAACEDALTLDPDDADALRLLETIQHMKQQREQESKERHERERIQRQRLADAELKLARGDVAGAAALLQQVLAANPHDAVALAMLPRVKEAASTSGVTVEVAAAPDATVLVDRRPLPPPVVEEQPAAPARRGVVAFLYDRMFVTATIAAAAIAVIVIVPMYRSASNSSTAVPPAATQTSTQATPAPTPAPTSPATPEQAPATVPAATPARTPAVDNAASAEARTRELAMRTAERSIEVMNDAEQTATAQKAGQLARDTFAAARQAKTRADRSFAQGDYVQAGQQALTAADLYRRAGTEAGAAAASRATSVPASPPSTLASPPPSNTTPSAVVPSTVPSPATPSAGSANAGNAANANTPAAAPSNAAAATPAPVVVPKPAEVENAALVGALNKFRFAYRDQNMKALLEVYPTPPREMRQGFEKMFRDCKSTDVTFANMNTASIAQDSTSAIVTARSTYVCQPKSRQPAVENVQNDIFQLRKLGGIWVIDDMGSMNQGKR